MAEESARDMLGDADNAIGQVIMHAESWQEQGGILEARYVAAVLLDVLAPWTGGQERSEEEARLQQTRPWPYDGPKGRARLTGNLCTEEPS